MILKGGPESVAGWTDRGPHDSVSKQVRYLSTLTFARAMQLAMCALLHECIPTEIDSAGDSLSWLIAFSFTRRLLPGTHSRRHGNSVLQL